MVNGILGASGRPSNVALEEGANTIRVVVTAEDGKDTNVVTLTVNRLPFRTRVWVLNGIGGVPVDDTVLKLVELAGPESRVIAENVPLPREKNGKPVFGLDPKKKYSIYATGTAAAAACYANFDPSKEDTASLYCLRNSATFFYELEAPVIEDISFGTANNDAGGTGWRVMPNEAQYTGPLANIAAVKVTALTRNWVPQSGGSLYYNDTPYPMLINIDETASSNSGGATGSSGTPMGTSNSPVTVDGKQWYRNTFRFATPLLQTNIFNKEHYLSVVVYDVIRNRTEQRAYLTITDSANAVTTDPDLSGFVPPLDYAQAQTFVGGGDLTSRPGDEANAMDPLNGYNGYQQVIARFYARSSATAALPIRGYEVWRSLGNASNFARIAVVNYAATNSTTSAIQYTDRTPSLVAGDVYYRFRVFNGNPTNNGYSQLSANLHAVVMPPTYTKPAASHKVVSDKLWPAFRIAADNPAMLSKGTSDAFTFTLFVKNADGPYPFLLIPFWVDFTETDTIAGASDEVNGHRYGFPKGRPTVRFMRITEWDGTSSVIYAGSWHYACDSETVPDGGGGEKTVYTPFAYLDDDGSVVVDTNSKVFRVAMDNAVRETYGSVGEEFAPGSTYYWNIFGANAGIGWNAGYPARWYTTNNDQAAFFYAGSNPAPNAGYPQGFCYGSAQMYGWGSPEGWFPITIAPDAK
jgi:hypothetical protein